MSAMSRTTKIALGAGLGLIVLIVGGAWFGGYFSSEPEEQTIEDALAAVSGETEGDDDATTDVDAPAEASAEITTLDGVWSVVADSETFVGYRINEVFTGGRDFEAVGRTPEVSGSFTGAGTVIESVEISADLRELASDSSSRDGQVRRVLNTDEFGTGTFVLTAPIDIGSIPAEGESVNVDATGDLTINGVTQSVTFPLDAAIQSGLVIVVGQIEVLLSDFDVETPSAPIVASVEDDARVEVSLIFQQG